jgi:hypothetical protein
LCELAQPYAEALSRRGQLEPDDARHDEPQAYQATGVGWLTEQNDAKNGCANGSDPDPDCIRGTHWKRLHGDAKENDATDHGCQSEGAGPELGEAFCVLEPDSPPNLEQTCDNQQDPRHDCAPEEKVRGFSLRAPEGWCVVRQPPRLSGGMRGLTFELSGPEPAWCLGREAEDKLGEPRGPSAMPVEVRLERRVRPHSSPRVELELARAPLLLARDSIAVAVHLDARTVGEEVFGLVA